MVQRAVHETTVALHWATLFLSTYQRDPFRLFAFVQEMVSKWVPDLAAACLYAAARQLDQACSAHGTSPPDLAFYSNLLIFSQQVAMICGVRAQKIQRSAHFLSNIAEEFSAGEAKNEISAPMGESELTNGNNKYPHEHTK